MSFEVLIDGSPAPIRDWTAGRQEDRGVASIAVPELAGYASTEEQPSASASVVSEYIAPAPTKYLPQMLVATTAVAIFPLALSLTLRATGVIASGWLSVGLAIVVSLATSSAGSVYWRKHGGAGEILFGELLLWGWLRRWRQERELATATELLQTVNPGREETLTVERREHLLRQLAGALEGQDMYLNGHSRRVSRHAMMIARGMGLPSEEVARVRAAAAVHDVGKLLTPKAILNKPGRLTDAEFEVIKRHPVDGAEMVSVLGDPELTRIVRHHHERLDGAGYPDRLSSEEIPLGARIIAVADTFDAITSARPYRDASPHQKAIDILRNEAGSQLDPDAVRAFLAYYSGSRPTVIWALLTSSVRRLVAWLSGDPAAAATLSASKVAAAAAATAAIGTVAGAAPVPVVHASPARATVAAHHAPAPRAGVVLGTRRAGGSPVLVARPTTRSTHRTVTETRTRARGAHAAAVPSAAARRAGHPTSAPGRSHSGTAAASPAPGAGAAPNPSTGTGSTSPTTPSAGSVSNSSAGGAASRPTSTNPAGHVNHASSTGNAARSGQPPQPTPPGHSGSSNSDNAGGQSSQAGGNANASSSGGAQDTTPTGTASAAGAGSGPVNAPGAGPNASSDGNTQGAVNNHASAAPGTGNGNGSGNGSGS